MSKSKWEFPSAAEPTRQTRESMLARFEPVTTEPPLRAAILDEAKSLVDGDRNNQYGPPDRDFQRSAEAANAYGYRGPGGRPLKAHDIAVLISLVKFSRVTWQPEKRDNWVDVAGYAACGYECVTLEDQ